MQDLDDERALSERYGWVPKIVGVEPTLSERYGWFLLVLSITAPLMMDFALAIWRSL